MAHIELDLRERRAIEDMLNAKVPVSKIAAEIGRHRSTVYREIKRNYFYDDELPYLNGYYGMNAQKYASDRRARRRKLIRHPDLCKAVVGRIKQGWTPEQIGDRMIYEGATPRVCQETIYRYIYSKEGMTQELWWYLPEHRKSRRPRRARKRQKPKFDGDVSSCSVPMTSRTADSLVTGKLILSCSNNALANRT